MPRQSRLTHRRVHAINIGRSHAPSRHRGGVALSRCHGTHDAERYADRLVDLSEQEGEHQGLLDPFDRSVALVFALIEESGLDPWAVDLGAFVRIFSERVSASPKVSTYQPVGD